MCSTGTKIPFEKALTATFLEGLVFLGICFTGMRSRLLRLFPKTVLMAGAVGIGEPLHCLLYVACTSQSHLHVECQ